MRLLLPGIVLVVAGTGGLTFMKSIVDVPDAPRRLDAADLDGDGDVDLFVLADAAGQAASLRVLLNDGGEFTPGWSLTQPTGSNVPPGDLDLADTDGDGDVDALYILPSGGPNQRFNDGNAGFDNVEFLPVFALRAEQEPADMDDDGDVDLIYYEEDIVGYFGTLEGAGDGSFEFNLATETWGIDGYDLGRRFEVGDIDGDGLRDVAMTSIHGLRFIPSHPLGPAGTMPAFEGATVLYATPCVDVALADLDGNGRLDVVATVPSKHSVVVLLSQVAGGFTGPTLFPAGANPGAITSTDLDLDGRADVVVTNPSTNRVNVLLGNGSGGFLAPEDFRVGLRPVDVVAADFDDDSDPDLAVACSIAGHVTVLLNNATQSVHTVDEGF
jgi:hypothetical protein